jgi:hypothetical protein
LDDLKEARRYWKLKEEAQDRTPWRTQFGRGYGPVTKKLKKYVKYRSFTRPMVDYIIKHFNKL